MFKRILSVLLTAIMLLTIGTVAMVSAETTLPEKEEGKNRYYFYLPDEWKNEYTDTAGIYWWEGSDFCSYWPGYTANKADVEDVYYYDVPQDVTMLVWNNALDGGMDITQDIYTAVCQTVNIGCEYYEPGESENYPDGTDSFDEMIYVIDLAATWVNEYNGIKAYSGEWYYYYGNGEYGFTPEKGDEVFTGKTYPADATVDEAPVLPSTPDETTPDETTPDETTPEEPTDATEDTTQGTETPLPEKEEGKNRYYFYMPDEWKNEYADSVGIYWWNGTDSCSNWPGYTANKTDMDGVYYYDVPMDVFMVIWNNNIDGGTDISLDIYSAATQTVNIGTEYYDPGESENYPDGTISFDDMIYVIDPTLTTDNSHGREFHKGEWYYYYGNGEYGFTPEKGDEVFTGKTHVISGDDAPEEPTDAPEEPTDAPEEPTDVPEEPTDVPEEPTQGTETPVSTYRYYFYMPDEWKNEYTDTAGIYWWLGTNYGSSWPGYTANETDVDGVYYYDVPTDVDFVIWNNNIDGGTDTSLDIYSAATQTVNIGTEYYDPGESKNYPEGTDNFDGMIYVIDPTLTSANKYGKETHEGEWYYYYGNGEYGFTPEKGDEVFTGKTHVISGGGTETPVSTYRYYFYMPDEWKNEYTDTAGIYWWLGTNYCSSWPGYTANETDVDGVYYYDVPTDVDFVIWNNAIDGGSDPSLDIFIAVKQTVNIGTEYYDPGESDNYPEGTDNFDGMIYVIDPTINSIGSYDKEVYKGEWYYYYGNGEYGFTPEKGDEVFTGKTHVISGEDVTTPDESTPDAVVLTDNKTGVSVEGKFDAQLAVKEVTADEMISDIDFILVGIKAGKVYDITLSKDGAELQPGSAVTVKIPAIDESSKVYRMEKDGTLTDMGAVYEDGFLVFTTEHFSIYVVTEKMGFDIGDVNMDGDINIKDATEIQKNIAKLLQLSDDALYLADFDRDNYVNIKDATAIQKFIAGIVE